MYKGIKCCEQQLRRVDKALSRAGDIAVGSWTCLSHRNLILAEDKRLCGENCGEHNFRAFGSVV